MQMNNTGFTAGYGLMLASPCPGKDGASGAVAGSIAPRDTGATVL